MDRELREKQAKDQKARMLETAQAFPYWMLDVPDQSKAKSECVAADGKARLWNDCYWDSAFPPCDRDDCLCRVIALNERQVLRLGILFADGA